MWIMESMPNPMAILQAGADITSSGMPSQPTIPKTMTGMTQILAVMAKAILSDLDAIHATTYPFTANYHVLVTPNDNNSVTVILEAKDKDRDLIEDLKEFANSLIDYQVRLQLDRANGKIRELIVAHAFSPLDLHKEVNSL